MSKLDFEIDRAVREMLDVEPPAGLRGRVLERLELSNPVASASRRKDNFRRKFAWVALPLAAAAILVLALVLPSRTDRTVVNPPATVATRQTPPPRPVETSTPASAPTVTPQVRPETVTARSIPRAVRPPNAQPPRLDAVAPEDVVWIDPLAKPAAMAVAPMAGPPTPAVTSIDLAPAQIPALEVRPISDTPRERRNQE